MINFDLTVSLSVILQAIIFAGGGIAAFVTLRIAVKSLKESQAAWKTETKEQFAAVQAELKELNKILIAQGRFDERLTSLDKRVTSQGRKIDELSHGVGFIRGSRTSIEGEYK